MLKVRVWKEGKPLDYQGRDAITVLAILFMEKEVRLGIIWEYGIHLHSRDGKVIGIVSYDTPEEYEVVFALSVAGRVKRERKKDGIKVRVKRFKEMPNQRPQWN